MHWAVCPQLRLFSAGKYREVDLDINDMPGDIQLMLLHDLPAYSILNVLDQASGIQIIDSVRKQTLLRLLKRDVFDPWNTYLDMFESGDHPLYSSIDADKFASLLKDQETLSVREIRAFYDRTVEQVALGLYNGAPTHIMKQMWSSRGVIFKLEGHHFALLFRQQFIKDVGARWMCHTTAERRLFKVLPSNLGQAISRFTNRANQQHIFAELGQEQNNPLFELVRLVVAKVDPSVQWTITVNRNSYFPSFYWASEKGSYRARPDFYTVSAMTHFFPLACRSPSPVPDSWYDPNTPASTVEERIAWDYFHVD